MKSSVPFLAFLLILAALITSAAGCGDMAKVTGRVTYADGTPLSTGQVVFTDDFWMAKSDIDPETGEYSLHSLRRNDGIRKGTYRVYIAGAIGFEKIDQKESALAAFAWANPVLLIDMQYTNPDTSGWVVEVKKNTKVDLVVYQPGKVPEEERTEMAKRFFDPDYREQHKNDAAVAPERKRRLVNPSLL